MRQVAAQHLATKLRSLVQREQVATARVPCGQRCVHRCAELGRAGRARESRQQVVGRRGQPPHLTEPVPDRADLEVVQLREADLHFRRYGGGRR